MAKAADNAASIAVLPLGATEQHGPHLPVETDTIVAAGIAAMVARQLPPDLDVEFLAAEPVGYSREHMDFAGTKTLSYDQAIDRWIGLGADAHRRGINKFVMLNAHGGNSPLMTIVAQELRVRHNMLAVATSWTRFIKDSPLIAAREHAIGIHGGEIETSVMLALRPDLVDMDKAADFSSLQQSLIDRNKYLRAYGPHAFGWKMSDLNAQGVTGNAAAATPQKGRSLLDQAVNGLLQLIEEISTFDIDAAFTDG